MKIVKDPVIIKDYLRDEGGYFGVRGDVEAVYYPESEEDVKGIIEDANRRRVFCTVSGAGTGTRGGRIPVYGGIVLSMEKMMGCKDRYGFERMVGGDGFTFYIQMEKKEVWVGAGLSIKALCETMSKDLFWPPEPTETSAFIGGNLATDASGARSFFYGKTRDWVNGVSVVLGVGDILRIERGKVFADKDGWFDFRSESGKRYRFKVPNYTMPKVKSSAGLYKMEGMDLLDLFIGSEGILGVFTEVNIRLSKKEEVVGDIAFFSSKEDAIHYVDALRMEKRRGILSIEYLDEGSLEFIRERYPDIKREYKACVMVEISRHDETLMEDISNLMQRFNVRDDWCVDDEVGLLNQKEFRHTLPEAINNYLRQNRCEKIGTDLVVPISKFHKMMHYYNEAGEEFKARFKRKGPHYLLFGHIGEAHLHLNIIPHSMEEREYARSLCFGLAKRAVSLGGTVSGEHGIGKRYIDHLELMYGKDGLYEIARIKGVFDPNGILNPGNMIPLDLLQKILK